MTHSEKLNSLATVFSATQDQSAFEELHAAFKQEWDRRKFADAKRAKSDVHTIESMYGVELWECARKYDPAKGDIVNLVNNAIRRRRIDILRSNTQKRKGRYQHVSINANDDSDAPTFEIAEEFDTAYSSPTEEAVFREMFDKKEKDKVSLVSYLIESAKTTSDEATIKIIEMFSQHKNPSTLAKALGMHHETVKRKLVRLSRHYDANRFGDIREYLAV